MTYQRILAATDLSEESNHILERAALLAQQNKAQLHIIHVQEPISMAYGGEFPVDLSELHKELEKQARSQLESVAKAHQLDASAVHFEIGITEKEVIRIAEKLAIDLIVVGSHGRHGLSLLLGSTANGILHHAKMDVLAVRVGQDDEASA